LLILLALKERRVEVEVGYDLEQWITGRLCRRDEPRGHVAVLPKGQFGQGLRAGTEAIIGRIAQGRGVTLEGVRVLRQPSRATRPLHSGWLPIAIFVVILIVSRLGGGGADAAAASGGAEAAGRAASARSAADLAAVLVAAADSAAVAAADLAVDSADSGAAAAAEAAAAPVGRMLI
jgi:uncharacterized membrane protein YgcG